MTTEDAARGFEALELWPTRAVVQALVDDQAAAAAAVATRVESLQRAADEAAARLKGSTGRLVYVGAGTSGRVAAQDGVELTPTYDWPESRLLVLLAGGDRAMLASVEGAEDDTDTAAEAVARAALAQDDVVIGVAASGRTPYTVAALTAAREAGALVISVSNNPDSPLLKVAHHAILLDTGSEVVAGSTRMKAGTAQKIALNVLSTAIMIRLGRTYRGEMVAMRASNAKLRRRAVRIVARLTGVPESEAADLVQRADGNIKLAVLLASGLQKGEAGRRLSDAEDDLRQALADPNH